MAKLTGILPLRGTIQNMTFAHTKDGVIVRKKTLLTKSRIENDPAFVRTRENMAEFKTAAKAAKLISGTFRNSVPSAKGSRLHSKLLKLMHAALSYDTTNVRGQRTVTEGQLAELEQFNFDEQSKLGSVLMVPFTTVIDRTAGEMEVGLPAYVPADSITIPAGATHYRVVVTGADLDFDNNAALSEVQRTSYLPIDHVPTAPTTVTIAVTPNSTNVLILSVGIEFFQETGAVKNALKNGDAHAVVKVDQ